MQAASRESLAAVEEYFDRLARDAGSADLQRIGGELAELHELLHGEHVLRKHLSEPSSTPEAKRGIAGAVLAGKIGDDTLGLVAEIVARRWSRSSDFLGGIEHVARLAVLVSAERDGRIDDVEDELFRFSRMLSSETRLRTLLAEASVPFERRAELLDGLLDGRAAEQTSQLVRQAIRVPRGVSLDVVVAELAEQAAARRDESVVRVTAAAPLSDQQRQRLAEVLSRIYARNLSIQVEIDPEVLGGLVIRMGDEVIDGSVASRLAKASRDLPD
jgi:F-type H+-transporting ATPase subunit delta